MKNTLSKQELIIMKKLQQMEWGQFVVTPKNIQNWLTRLENVRLFNWSAVMFCIAAGRD